MEEQEKIRIYRSKIQTEKEQLEREISSEEEQKTVRTVRNLSNEDTPPRSVVEVVEERITIESNSDATDSTIAPKPEPKSNVFDRLKHGRHTSLKEMRHEIEDKYPDLIEEYNELCDDERKGLINEETFSRRIKKLQHITRERRIQNRNKVKEESQKRTKEHKSTSNTEDSKPKKSSTKPGTNSSKKNKDIEIIDEVKLTTSDNIRHHYPYCYMEHDSSQRLGCYKRTLVKAMAAVPALSLKHI